MNQNKIKILTILFSISLLISCKGKSALLKNEPPVTFSFFSVDLMEPELFDDVIAKEITKLTNVYLDLIPRTTELNECIKILIANGNYPDLIFAKGDLSSLIEVGAVIPLDDYIEKYGENIKKLYGNQIVKLRNTLEDPHIYSVGTYEVKTSIMEISGNLQIQNAVLREFGYPSIKTLDDYENLLLAYKKKYPVINGKNTLGLSLLTDTWYWLLSLSNPGNYLIGYPDDGQWIVDQNTMKATYKFLYPEMKIFYKWLNKIYHEGLLDPESFTQTEDLWKSKIASGCVLGTAYPYWGLGDLQNGLVQNDMAERTFAYLPITADEKYKDPTLKDYGFSGGWGIAISKNCKDPVRAFKFLDWMCSEQAQILTNWGIEGEDYFYDGTGHRISSLSIDETRGIGHWVYPFPQGGAGFIDSTGNPLGKTNREIIIKKYNIAEKETLKAYGAECWPDLFPTSQELGVSKHGQVWQYPLSTPMKDLINEADDYVKDSLIKMIIGSEENFDAEWKKMTEHLVNMGISKVEEEVTNLISMKMELWKK